MSKHFQNPMEKSYKEATSISLKREYIAGHFPGFVQVLQ